MTRTSSSRAASAIAPSSVKPSAALATPPKASSHLAPMDPYEALVAWAEPVLRADRVQTVAALRDLSQTSVEEGPSADQLDAASQQEARDTQLRHSDRLKARLADIDRALQKIETGDYGLCEHSGDEIPEARLRANPLARYTVEIQERLEHRKRQGL